MTNEQNLIPVRSEREAREKGRKGGIKSGEVRRKRKSLKEELLALLGAKVDGKTMQEKISLSLIKEAVQGNVRAYETIRDTIGEKQKENINVSGEINNPFSNLSTEELREIVNAK